jgi:A/G-specific adenine glycosylase
VKPEQKKHYQRAILRWYSSNRRQFYWRNPNVTPFQILIAEMLLRKTRAESVDSVMRKFFRLYSSIKKLAHVSVVDLENLLKPLGLQRTRARAIQRIANILAEQYQSRVPRDIDNLLKLPHVGRYAANAVLCFAFGERRSIVDGNIIRLFSRIFGMKKPVEIHKAENVWKFADTLLPSNRVKEFNWALLDLAALVCRPKSPDCVRCPISWCCLYYARTAASFAEAHDELSIQFLSTCEEQRHLVDAPNMQIVDQIYPSSQIIPSDMKTR